MSCAVSQLGFPIHTKYENENPMTFYIPIRFNIFLVSEKNYILVTDFPRKLETFAVTNNIPPNLIQLR